MPGRRWVTPLAAAAALCLAAAGALTAMVLSGVPLGVDELLAQPVHEWAHGSLAAVPVAELLRWTGSPLLLTPLTLGVVVVLVLRGRGGYGAYLAATAIGGVVISETVKRLVARPRPVWPDPLDTASNWSYPSGHSLAGITNWVVYGVIALLLVPGRGGRVLAVGCILWGLLMAPSRVVLGVHWPTDVVAGWLFGFGWVAAVSAVAVSLVGRR